MILHFHLLDIYVLIHDKKEKQKPTIASKLEKQLALWSFSYLVSITHNQSSLIL